MSARERGKKSFSELAGKVRQEVASSGEPLLHARALNACRKRKGGCGSSTRPGVPSGPIRPMGVRSHAGCLLYSGPWRRSTATASLETRAVLPL
jgi:hypothetical protein